MRQTGLFLLAFLFTVCTTAWAEDEPLPLYEAYDQDLVTVKGGSAGDHTKARLEIKNETAKPIKVEVMGSYLEPVGGDEQRLGLAFTPRENQHVVEIEPKKSWSGTFHSFCMDHGNPGPNRSTKYRLAKRSVPKLIKEIFMYWLEHDAIPQATVQSCVWSFCTIPQRLREIASENKAREEAMREQWRKHREQLIQILFKQVDMAIAGDGRVFFGKGTLDDLRQLGVKVPEIGNSLVIAAAKKEREQALPADKDGEDKPIRLRRYFTAAGHVFGTAPGGLFRYDTAKKQWLNESPVRDVRKIVGTGNGPFVMLAFNGGVYHKATVGGAWKRIGGPYSDIVLAPTNGDPQLLALDGRKKRFYNHAGESRWTPAMSGSTAYRYARTDGELFRFDKARGKLFRHERATRKWRVIASKTKEVRFGKKHVWLFAEDGRLLCLEESESKPIVIKKKVDEHYVARVRYGTDQIYLKTRAHLVIVYETTPYMEEAR